MLVALDRQVLVQRHILTKAAIRADRATHTALPGQPGQPGRAAQVAVQGAGPLERQGVEADIHLMVATSPWGQDQAALEARLGRPVRLSTRAV